MTDVSVIAILITVLLALMAFAFGYGILTNKVNGHDKEIIELKQSYKTIDAKLDDICNKVGRIETVLKERSVSS